MTSEPVLCPREQEVLDLLAIGRWPSGADDDLLKHAAACDRCTDLAAVARAVLDLRDVDDAAGRIPNAGLVWYRAQVRAREAAVQRAARPLFLAEAAAFALVIGGLAIWASGQTDPVVAASGAALATASAAAGDLLNGRLLELGQLGLGGIAPAGVSPWAVASFLGGLAALVALALGLSRLADADTK